MYHKEETTHSLVIQHGGKFISTNTHHKYHNNINSTSQLQIYTWISFLWFGDDSEDSDLFDKFMLYSWNRLKIISLHLLFII